MFQWGIHKHVHEHNQESKYQRSTHKQYYETEKQEPILQRALDKHIYGTEKQEQIF